MSGELLRPLQFADQMLKQYSFCFIFRSACDSWTSQGPERSCRWHRLVPVRGHRRPDASYHLEERWKSCWASNCKVIILTLLLLLLQRLTGFWHILGWIWKIPFHAMETFCWRVEVDSWPPGAYSTKNDENFNVTVALDFQFEWETPNCCDFLYIYI